MKYTTIYLVRHGETDWNAIRRIQGHIDIALNNNGIKQAKKLGKQFTGIKFDAVFSSDLIRAKRTAEIITLEKKMAIVTTCKLREKSFGQHEGKYFSEYNKLLTRWDNLTDKEKHQFKVTPDMESNQQAVSRLITFLREISVAKPGKTILVVCHGGIISFLLIHLGISSYKNIVRLDNNGYVILETDGVDFFIKKIVGVKQSREVCPSNQGYYKYN